MVSHDTGRFVPGRLVAYESALHDIEAVVSHLESGSTVEQPPAQTRIVLSPDYSAANGAPSAPRPSLSGTETGSTHVNDSQTSLSEGASRHGETTEQSGFHLPDRPPTVPTITTAS
ncbi:hypothetical protein QF002_001072 [Paraburkholderia youngii]